MEKLGGAWDEVAQFLVGQIRLFDRILGKSAEQHYFPADVFLGAAAPAEPRLSCATPVHGVVMCLRISSLTLISMSLLLMAPMGCGGAPASTAQLSGQVTLLGAPVAYSRVIAMNRSTNEEWQTVTDAAGRYVMTLSNGFYDVGADDGFGETTMAYGLVRIEGVPEVRDFALPPDLEPDQVVAVVCTDGTHPAGNYSLHFMGTFAAPDEVLDLDTTTNEQGEFSVRIDRQQLFDVEVYDQAGELVESVDFHKLDGALRLVVELGDEEDNNVHRHHQSSLPTMATESNGVMRAFSVSDGNQPFRFTLGENNFYDHTEKTDVTEHVGNLRDGRLCSNAGSLAVVASDYNNAANSSAIAVQDLSMDTLQVQVRDDGGWWFTYAAHVTGTRSAAFRFTDESPDTYSLGVSSFGDHKVSYNSYSPCIVAVNVTYR